MNVASDINKALSRDSRFREQDDILFMALKRNQVPAIFYLRNGNAVSGIIRTRYADFITVTDSTNDHYVRLKAIDAIVIRSDFGAEVFDDVDED